MQSLLGSTLLVVALNLLLLLTPQVSACSKKKPPPPQPTPYPDQGGNWPTTSSPIYPGNPRSCRFSGPQDYNALRGQNFIENLGVGSCLTARRNGGSQVPIETEACTWNSLPISSQLFSVLNGNGGTILKTTVSGFGGTDTCLTTGFGNVLRGVQCASSGKDSSQTWRFTRVRDNAYQVMQQSTSMCLKAEVGRGPVVERCNNSDQKQLWRICTSN